MIRRATIDDLDAVYDLLVPDYFEESVYSETLDICPVNCRAYFASQIMNDAFVSDIDGEIVAYASVAFGYTVYTQQEADIDFFYIRPDYRGKGIARELVEEIVDLIDIEKCGVTYATSRSKTDGGMNNALWENLFKKFDFEIAGSMMIRFGE